MKYFAGLDVSLEETAICVVDEKGSIMREVRAASEPDALTEALRGIGLALERIGLEACSLAAWLHEGLTQAGLPARREARDPRERAGNRDLSRTA
jgi:transposase